MKYFLNSEIWRRINRLVYAHDMNNILKSTRTRLRATLEYDQIPKV